MKDFSNIYKLSKIERLGSVRISKLLNKYGTAENVLNASVNDLKEVDGFDKTLIRSLTNLKLEFNGDITRDYELLTVDLRNKGVNVITLEDKEYPELLKNIYDPPVILYYKGDYYGHYNAGRFNSLIGIVGTRNASEYGKSAAKKIASELSELGIGIISGFARGIDTQAHTGCILANNPDAITIAVLGCGVDKIYPPENINLYNNLAKNGVILSEYEIGAAPDAVNFPKRNRIISGMAMGVIIVESTVEGGAMITARYAMDQSREVFAVPGNINSKQSSGTNYLIKNNQAKLIENVNDVIDEIKFKIDKLKKTEAKKEKSVLKIKLQEKDLKIYNYLDASEGPVDIDKISVETGLSISDSLVTLLNLEFKGIIKQLPGKRFILN